jgi:hypothetical protein
MYNMLQPDGRHHPELPDGIARTALAVSVGFVLWATIPH